VIALLAACGPEGAPAPAAYVPRHRLVDVMPSSAARARQAILAIDDDLRHTLGPAAVGILRRRAGAGAGAGTEALRVVPASVHAGLDAIVVRGGVREGPRAPWRAIEPRLLPLASAEPGDGIPLELPEAGPGVRLQLSGVGPVAPQREVIASPPLAIPPDARLDFAIGLYEVAPRLAPEQAPVRFRIGRCPPEAAPGSLSGCSVVFDEILEPRAARGGGWRDRRLGLDASPEPVELRFETSSPTAERSPFSFPLWADPTVLVPTAKDPERRNVLLISLDTLRADHLPSYGHPLDTAPFLERHFAQEGVLFEQVVAAAASTGPSHMSMLTGLDVREHQVQHLFQRLSPELHTLAELLREHGFVTGAVTENGALGVPQGFPRGFDSYRENEGARATEFGDRAEETLALAEAWLRRHRDSPFLLFVHTYLVHAPYEAPDRYRDRFLERPGRTRVLHDVPPERSPARYDQEIRYLDDLLRDFFERLADLDLDRDTVLIVTSDHGEEFYEHAFLDHGATVFETAIRVPLLLRGPGLARGRRIREPVAHADLLPTILALAGVPGVEQGSGRDLSALVEAAEPSVRVPERLLFSETRIEWGLSRHHRGRMIVVPTPSIAVRRGDHKLMETRDRAGTVRRRYFDLARDPYERRDLLAEGRHAPADLTAALDGYARRYEAFAQQRRAEKAAGGSPDEVDLRSDPELEDALRALGYVR